MKKVTLLVATGAVLISLVAGSAVMASGKSNAELYLYEKDPTDWTIVEDGARGKLRYNLAGPEFEYGFNGHGLEAYTDYSLIYYPEPQTDWPWWVKVIDSGTTNNGGNINLAGSVNLGRDLDDPPYEGAPDGGAKIWLVLTDDINKYSELQGWNPTEYLFENNLIFYDDTDV